MEFVRAERFICTLCGMITTQKPDELGHAECIPCFLGMTLEQYKDFCKDMQISDER